MVESTSSTSLQPLSSSHPEDEQAEVNIAGPSTSTSKKQAPPAKKPFGQTAKERFTKQDREFIVSWLEHVPNFTSVFGSGGQTTVGQPNKSRNYGYATLADAVSKQSKGRLNINGKSMREWFQRHMEVFTSTKAKGNSMGFGVTEEDTKNGIYTVAHKLDKQDGRQESSTAPQLRHRLVMEEEEVDDYIAAQDRRGLEDGNAVNTYTQDDNIINDNVDNSFYNDDADYQEDSVRDTNVIDGDEISILSISSPVLQRQPKRRLTDTESQVSKKQTKKLELKTERLESKKKRLELEEAREVREALINEGRCTSILVVVATFFAILLK
ncbi:hypothetical protein BGX33_009800 [Mortierella sp. NVP41]|nr:hypothetical protein BGX33_009800 [Mortierella sp. NVP41]